MGDCSTNCNPCGPSYDAINQLAVQTKSYARQALSAVTTVEEFQSLYLGAKATAPTTDNEGNPLQVGAIYFNTTDGQMYVWAGSAWEFFGQSGFYLGPKASDPTTDNEGNPLVAGLLYFNTVSNTMRVYNGTFWQNVSFDEATPFLATGTTEPRNLATRFADVVNVLDFGADPTGAVDSTFAIQAAVDSIPNGGTVFVPAGEYSVKRVNINHSYISIIGAENNATKFISPAGRWGQTIRCNDQDFVSVKNITFDNNLAEIEGALWFGGARNCIIENCKFLNGDLTSMIIAGQGGTSGGTRIAYDNVVKDCYAFGQKRYTPGGTSPFIAGNNAQRTSFINCVVEDCEADAFDADGSPDTLFQNCVAIKNGTQSTYSAFWSEGEIDYGVGMKVTWDNCIAINHFNGFGSSELVDPTIKNCTVKNSERAIWSRTESISVDGGKIIDSGLSSQTLGCVLIEKGANINNIIFSETIGDNAISVYTAAGLQAGKVVNIENCVVDKAISIGYENNGAEHIRVSGCTFNNTVLGYFSCSQKTLIAEGNIFIDSRISGSRIKDSLVVNNTFKDNTASLTAINLTLDTFNTYVDNNTFIGYLVVNGNNRAIIGRNKYIDCATSPDDRDYITKSRIEITTGGTNYNVAKQTTSRGSYLLLVQGEGNDRACGAYLIQGASSTAGHTVTPLAEKPDFGTSDYFIVTFPSGGPIQITHPTSGRIANCTLIGYIY